MLWFRILIIWQLEESSSKTASFAFYQKKASPIKQAHLRDKKKKASRSICKSTVVSSRPLSPSPSPSSAMKTPENTEEGPDDSEPADEGDIQMEYTFD
jgi:ABC-type uncharacterized transport system involved in gliding motility auxiliary subunit